MTTKVKHMGSQREWEGSIDQWTAHSEAIKHWCDGGEVERLVSGNRHDVLNTGEPLLFRTDFDYRIKQREPKAGEVWAACGTPYLRTGDLDWVCLDDGIVAVPTNGEGMSYEAPFLEAYYAREFLNRGKGKTADVHRCVTDAAKLD